MLGKATFRCPVIELVTGPLSHDASEASVDTLIFAATLRGDHLRFLGIKFARDTTGDFESDVNPESTLWLFAAADVGDTISSEYLSELFSYNIVSSSENKLGASWSMPSFVTDRLFWHMLLNTLSLDTFNFSSCSNILSGIKLVKLLKLFN